MNSPTHEAVARDTVVHEPLALAEDLCAFIRVGMTPFHVVREVERRLAAAGFIELDEREGWQLSAGDQRYIIRGGTLVAFVVGQDDPAVHGYRILGAHTDSPNLRVKPRPDAVKSGYKMAGVEVYGGALHSTWMDRDLSIAGRVLVRRSGAPVERLVDLAAPMARVANLAIHLNRQVNSEGLTLNAQKHLVPVLGLTDVDASGLVTLLARHLGEDEKDVIGHDLSLYDVVVPTLGGMSREFVFSPRLDNLASCHAGTLALLSGATKAIGHTRVIALFDHEECGSRSASGAQGTMLADVLGRVTRARCASADGFERAMRRSLLVSADMAHAVHPNYSDMHEPEHSPKLGHGLVIKSNANQAYATSGRSAALFRVACDTVKAPVQDFVVRSDLPCGSTIGAITAALLGIETVDVGAPMLSMHSCREMTASADVAHATLAYGACLDGSAA